MTLANAHKEMALAQEESIFTSAVLRVSRSFNTVFRECYGTVGGTGTSETTHGTLFDLASLTKVLATTPCWMLLAAMRPEILDQPVSRWFPDVPADKAAISPRLLLAHSSGLPAWRPYYLFGALGSPDRLVKERIFREHLDYPPGQGSIYSDLGFVLLAAIGAIECGQPLDVYAREKVFAPLNISQDMMFLPDPESGRIAWTRSDDRPGMVNDLNARALGGVSGHAGLFGTADAVSRVAEEILRSVKSDKALFQPATTQIFSRKAGLVAGSTRALGFDTPSGEGSTSGHYFSAHSIGHTGFTGTSLWIDVSSEVIVTLLTNRVIMGEADQRIKTLRPVVHDAVMGEFL